MAFLSQRDARDGRTFIHASSWDRPSRTSRSWTSNGVHYVVDTTSYTSPGLSFGSMTGSAGGAFRSFTLPTRQSFRPSGGLFSGALGLLEDMLTTSQQGQNAFASSMSQGPSSSRRVHVQTESDADDDDLAYDDYDEDEPRSKGMLSRLKDRLLDNGHRTEHTQNQEHTWNSHNREQGYSREVSPSRRPPTYRRRTSYRNEARQPDWASSGRQQRTTQFIEAEDGPNQEDRPATRRDRSRRASNIDTNTIEALETAAECERRSVRACKRRIESASKQLNMNADQMQRLVDDLRRHETALINARAGLQEVKDEQRSSRGQGSASTTRRLPPVQRQQSAPTSERQSYSPFAAFGPLFPPPLQPDPLLRAFQESFGPVFGPGFGFHHQFSEPMRMAGDDPYFPFFPFSGPPPTSQRKHYRYAAFNGAPEYQQPGPGFSNFVPPPQQPPASLLTPDEAKRTFERYNDRWNAMSSTDTNIPYPSRGLKAEALSARDTIWAPLCNASVSTWSEEGVMQANAQAFYLGVVGLTPLYTDSSANGRLEMGFDKSRASPEQITDLVGLLKKEKSRWHSDRLGRRNGGAGGTNEALQKDARARAVFHAACELMEGLQ